MNKAISTPMAIIIILIVFTISIGLILLGYIYWPKDEVVLEEIKQKEKVEVKDEEGEIIPSAIALNDEKLINFLVALDHELGLPEGINLSFSKIIREDLSGNGVEEIIVVLAYEVKNGTFIRLIEKKNGNYQVRETQGDITEAYQIETIDVPLEYKSVVVDSRAHPGTGMGYEIKTIYTYIDGRLKETWSGIINYREDYIGYNIGYHIESIYNIELKDVDGDGEFEIIYKGESQHPECKEGSYDCDIIKENVSELYKWDDDIKEYKKIDY